MDKTDPKIAKIIAALSKAESTTPEEAEVAQAFAERLMIKYGIEQAELDEHRRAAGGHATEEIIERKIQINGIYSKALLFMGARIAESLKLQTLQSNVYGSSAWNIFVIGYESDVDLFEVLFSSLQLQSLTAVNRFWREHPDRLWLSKMQGFKERRQFIRSFGQRAAIRLAALRRDEVDQTPGTGTEIVLADRAARVTAWLNEAYPDLKPNNRPQGDGGSYHAVQEGRAAGDRADVGQPRIGDERRALR